MCHDFLELPDGGAVGGDEGPCGITLQILWEPEGIPSKTESHGDGTQCP